MLEALSFYNYQYRKDIIDKFNISTLEELQLPLQLKVTRRVQISKSRKRSRRRLRLLYFKTSLELVTGVSCGIAKIKKHGRVKSGVKINRHHYLYVFYCDLVNTRFIFNFINLLFCVAQIQILKLKFNFVKNLQSNELCVLSKLRDKYIVFVPKYRKRKKKSKLRCAFLLRGNNSNNTKKIKHFLLYFFFKRLKLVKPIKYINEYKFN